LTASNDPTHTVVWIWKEKGGDVKTAEEKYRNDPNYKFLVDSLMYQVSRGTYTPSELREAVIFACTRWELMQTNVSLVYPKESICPKD
jgi:hypothetical protein